LKSWSIIKIFDGSSLSTVFGLFGEKLSALKWYETGLESQVLNNFLTILMT
jgi:hypothetical protein